MTSTFADVQAPDEPELVSMIVMSYNQADYIEDAIRGAFAQTFQPLEIVLSDDASTDGTFEIMERMAKAYEGPHEVRLNRNTQNLGFVGHLNKVFTLCRGALIVYNPGDDISLPERVAELYAVFRDDRPLLVHSDVYNMNPDGSLNGLVTSRHAAIETMDLKQTARSMSLGIGATCAWNPDLVRLFGPIVVSATYDDLVFFFRARLLNRIAFVPKPLVRYRYGVGLSNRFEHGWTARVAHERNLLVLAADTYRQRLLDCSRISPDRTDIVEELQADLDKVAFKQKLYDAPFRAIPRCLLSWSRFKAGLSVLNRLRKITFSPKREEMKRAGMIAGQQASTL